MAERLDIDELLAAYRFEDAERLIDETPADLDPGVIDEIDRRRIEALGHARSLCQTIVDLGSEGREAEVAELARDPRIHRLLQLLDDASRQRSELYLREAERWEERKHETNARRLDEARTALDRLDLELARGLMSKIDGRFLSQELTERRDGLLLDISARTMELESLEETGKQLIEETKPGTPRRSWRRWFRSP